MSISEISDYSDSIGIYWPPINSEYLTTRAKIAALKIASYFTEPICKVREFYYSFYILDETCKNTAHKAMKVLFLTLGIIIYAIAAPFTTPVGIVVRGLVAKLESKPYIYLEREGKGKILPPDKKITLLTHNQCYMPAGYSITDGQITPPSDKSRMDANIQMIKKLNPDIACLYEVPDICDADYISSQLPDYPFVIPIAGVRAIGPNSMMYVASKYEIAKDSIKFTPFIKDLELTGRAKHSEKGFLSFDIKSNGTPFGNVISTHLQHSEFCEKPEEEDKRSRAAQMHKIAQHIKSKVDQGTAVIFTGDLNQDELELNSFLNKHQITWLRRDNSIYGKATWGGSHWFENLMGRSGSGPLVLDYAFIAGKAASISTRVIDSGYSSLEFRPQALSDHHSLFSTITVQ